MRISEISESSRVKYITPVKRAYFVSCVSVWQTGSLVTPDSMLLSMFSWIAKKKNVISLQKIPQLLLKNALGLILSLVDLQLVSSWTLSLTSTEIGDIAGVADVTIRQSYRLIYPRAAELFPSDFKFDTPVDKLPQLWRRSLHSDIFLLYLQDCILFLFFFIIIFVLDLEDFSCPS